MARAQFGHTVLGALLCVCGIPESTLRRGLRVRRGRAGRKNGGSVYVRPNVAEMAYADASLFRAQGCLPATLSGLGSMEVHGSEPLSERPFRMFWDQLGTFRPGDVPVLFPRGLCLWTKRKGRPRTGSNSSVSNSARETAVDHSRSISLGRAMLQAARHFSFNVTKAVHPWENTSEA